jgi:hypothetical protein
VTNGSPPITTAQATIATATVQIKTLTVSGKKLTLAVFRQLPSRDYAWIGGLGGERWGTGSLHDATPWGWVNHHSEACKGLGKHLHLIFDFEGGLYQDAVPHRASEATGWPFEYVYPDWNHAPCWVVRGTGRGVDDQTVTNVQSRWEQRYDHLAALPQLYIAA